MAARQGASTRGAGAGVGGREKCSGMIRKRGRGTTQEPRVEAPVKLTTYLV